MDLEALRALWKRSHVTIRRGATKEQLAALQDACLPFPLPASLRSYFEAIDGMDDYEMGPEEISFWSLDRVLQSMRSNGEFVYFDIADVLIMSDIISLRLGRDGDRVVSLYRDKEDLVANSFDEFISLYVAAPGSLIRRLHPNYVGDEDER